MSIRLRLTLLYTAILALTLIAFSAVLYFTLQRDIIVSVDQTLKDETQRLINNARTPEWPRNNTIQIPASKVAAPTTYVQTRDITGRIDQKSPSLATLDFDLPLGNNSLAALLNGDRQPLKATVNIDGRRLRIHNQVLIPRGGEPFIIQVARSLADKDETLAELGRILLIGIGVASIVAFGIGWVIAGAALRPIDRITQTTHAIGAERDFGRRVPHTGPQDEIGRLATTINGMLAALQGAYRQEAQALQAQRRFVADASHELRTPLTTIRGNIGLLQRYPPISESDRIDVLTDMVDESERMSRLVNDLLMLARADAGRPLRSEPVLVKPLIEDVCRKARAMGPDHNISCDDVQDVVVVGDPDALKQVLLILLDNALKFTPPQGRIMISTATDDHHVTITVRDTGVGIAPAALPHIFERFYRGDSSRTGSGTGLGLAIAKTLIDGQQGNITVESEVGVGTTFTLQLPRFVLPAVTQSTTESAAAANVA